MASSPPSENPIPPPPPSSQSPRNPNPNPNPNPSDLPPPPPPSFRHSQTSSAHPHLLSLSFNQDHGLFACGTTSGFRIFSSDPLQQTCRRDLHTLGSIALVEMLFKCNILALVGGGPTPLYPPNKVMIWDDHQCRCIGELSFRSEVRAVRLRRDRIVVVLEHKVYVYNFADLRLLHQIETIPNPRGLCALSPGASSMVLACLGLHCGQVRVEHYGLKKTKFIPAHESHVARIALTLDGRLLATASYKGTLIRIFNTLDGTRLQEVRRGADRAEIYSIVFSSTCQWLAVSSDRGTVHLFSLKIPGASEESVSGNSLFGIQDSDNSAPGNGNGNGRETQVQGSRPLTVAGANPGSSLSFLKGVLPKYFSSEWSFAQYRIPQGTKTLVAFGPQKNTVIILGWDGSSYRCVFDPIHGGEMQQQEFLRFMSLDDNDSGLFSQ